MTTKMTLIPVVLGLLIGCHQKESLEDPEQLKQVLVDYSDGIKARDLGRMTVVTTDDFELFENGKIWNNESLTSALNKFSKFTADYTFTNFRVNVDHASGSLSYFNHCACTYDTLTVNFDWIESATFEGQRKMENEFPAFGNKKNDR